MKEVRRPPRSPTRMGDGNPGGNSSSRRGSDQTQKKSQQLPPVGGGPNYGSKLKTTEERNAGNKKGKKEGLKPSKVRGTELDDVDEVWLCKRCKNQFADQNDKIMECECCEEHVCFDCLKINDDQYEK